MIAAAASTPFRAARPILVLLIACLAQFMLLADDTIVNVALPSLGADLRFSESSLSWVVNAYLLTFGGFLLVGGRVADHFGLRRVFATSLAAFALASAACGLAPTSGVLVAARGLQGMAGALLSPAALAILLAAFPEGAGRHRALSTWAALMGMGAAFGLLAGGVLVEVASWRWVFLVNLPVAAVALFAVPRVLAADDSSRARRAPNLPGAALGTLALLVLVFTVVESRNAGWTSARSVLGFVAAAGLAAGFAVLERRSSSPLLPAELIRRRRPMSADAVVFVAAGGLLAMFFFQTLYLQRVLGLSALHAGLAFLPFSAAMGLAAGAVGRLPDRVDPRLPIVAGVAAGAVGLWLMSRLGSASAYAPDDLLPLVVVAAGLGTALVPLMGLATAGAQERDGGVASALMTSAQQIGAAVGIAVMITIATTRTSGAIGAGAPARAALTAGFTAAFATEAVILLVAALLAFALLGPPRRLERRLADEPRDLAG